MAKRVTVKTVKSWRPMVQMILGNLHVGHSLGAAFSHVVGKLKGGRELFRSEFTPAAKREMVRQVRKIHHRNRAEFVSVMDRRVLSPDPLSSILGITDCR